MTVAIIGANSLLASYLIERYQENGCFLHLFSSSDPLAGTNYGRYQFHPFRYPETGIDLQILKAADYIIYCAANGVQAGQKTDTNLIYEVNAFLPIRLINSLEESGYKGNWISFGSYFEIGNNNADKAYTEEQVISSLLPVPNHYCSSKRLLTRFISNGNFKGRVWHFVLPTIYGNRENSQRLIPYVIAALKERKADLKLSSGQQVRQYIHCKDVADLLMQLDKMKISGVYNVTAGEAIQIADLVKTVFSLFEEDAANYLGTLQTRDESMKVLKLSSEKLSLELSDWQPKISLQSGVREYL